jgi:hypothetical protein
MILDAQLQFSKTQALTATAVSTNSIDLGVQRNIGIGTGMAVIVTCDVALAGTTPTLQVGIQFDDNSSFSSPNTVSSSIQVSALAAGSKIVVPVPAMPNGERYVRLNYTLGGTTPTATVTAYLQPASMVQNEGVYKDAYTIS